MALCWKDMSFPSRMLDCVFSGCGYPTNAASVYASSMFFFKKVMNTKHFKNLIGASYE